MPYRIRNIAFDLDGVLRLTYRKLEKKYNFKVKKYNFEINGMSFWDMLKDTPDLFLNSPKSKYADVVKKLIDKPNIWTFQRKEYKQDTITWLDNFFGKNSYSVKFFTSPSKKYEYLRLQKEYVLVEDTDQFFDYTRVVLIDRPYNKKINDVYRIRKVKELEQIIRGVYDNKKNATRKKSKHRIGFEYKSYWD